MGEIRLNDISYTGGGGGSSVEANPSGQATNTLVKLGVDDTIYGIDTGTDVEANPTGTATETLTKLGVDGTVYGIDFGTDVEANPSGTPTDELSKIGIDGTVYEIIGFELPEHVTMDETKIRISGDPTGWTSSENYYDEAISWSVGGRVYTKDNAQPALIAGCQYDGSALYHTVAVSTIAAGTHYRWENYVNDQDNEFEYKGRTWYYSGGEGSYHELPYVGINDIGHFSTMLDAAKYLIDQADLAGAHFVQMSDPETGTILAGGGEKEDLSDATFKVTNDGAVYATEFYKNGVPIGDGGGSSYSETTLWSGSETPTTSGMDITLSSNISDYDLLVIYTYDSNYGYGGDTFYLINDLAIGNTYISTVYAGNELGAYWTYTSDTSINIKRQASAWPVTYTSIKGIKFGGGYQLQPVIYSTEEREIGVWADGKPLYQKSFIKSNITLRSNAWFSTGETIPNGIAVDAEITNYEVDGASYNVACNIETNGGVYLLQTRTIDIGVTNAVITVRYTKTTDTPGSGTWTPQGVPAVHYSTEERIVGTWVDGSTVYEKTIYYAGGQSGSVTFNHNISNFGRLISIGGSCLDSETQNYMPITRIGYDGNNVGITYVGSTQITYAVASAFAARVVDVYLTIRYTKTS